MPSEDEEDTSSSATKAKALAVAEKYAAIALDSLCFQQKLAKFSEKAVACSVSSSIVREARCIGDGGDNILWKENKSN